MVDEGGISEYMANKAAESGLNMDGLSKVFREWGDAGLKDVLSAKGLDGKPRVTNRQNILEEFCAFFN